jgi:riboflavin synthase
MFTGIILAVGKISQIEQKSGDVRLAIDTGTLSLKGANLGDSIAVNGICLTAVELGEHNFVADVSNETLARTNLKSATAGTPVNLELALTPQTRLGGHIVSGHVDGLAKLLEQTADGRSIRFRFKAPDSLAKYIAEKGSICINGISLTINRISSIISSVVFILLDKSTFF